MKTFLSRICLFALLFLPIIAAKAHPYASGITNNGGNIQFILNEGGGTVNVVFEDSTTNAMGVLARGAQSFPLGAHTSYSIIVTKIGNGTPSLISTDTAQFSVWNSPRGVGVNQNPKLGNSFGRIYAGNGLVGGTTPNNKGIGLYALNADQTEALGKGTNATATSTFAGSGGVGPWRMRVAPDNTLLVNDFSTAAAALWQFKPDLSDSNLVLSIIGQTAAAAAGIHSDFSHSTPLMTGSLAAGNLVLWTGDASLAVPNATIAPSLVLGPGTFRGSFNCIYRYDIGAGPLPWNNPPNYAYTLGLDSIAGLRVEVELGKDGKIIGGFGRANFSNGDIQILDPTGTTKLYDSLHDGADLWNGIRGFGGAVGTYGGVRVSPDGRYLASLDFNFGITIASLIDGIPDESSIFNIPNTPYNNTTGTLGLQNARGGMDWDAANNLYVYSQFQGLLRIYSLGITTTCVTSNDFTGTNGSFQLILPAVSASVVATTPTASQNYINNATPGTPIPGVFTITLTTNHLIGPVVVNYTLGGTAVYLSNYTLNTNNALNGIIVTSNTVTFPAGDFPGGGNWSQVIIVTPTATPVIGPTLPVTLRVSGGATYTAAAPLLGTVSILNTGPQLLTLSAASAALGATMNRGIPGDYANFIITRTGDLNGPGNGVGSVTPTAYTVTNFFYTGTAIFPTDYAARAQRKTAPGTEVPVNGEPGIIINPGDIIITNIVGNPVAHANLTALPTNVTVIISLTNAVSNTNLTSAEGKAYTVAPPTVTLTELDNTVGPEVVLWSNPMTNSLDSTNWTLTFASTNLGATTQLPVVITNYANVRPDPSDAGGTNNFDVTFGNPVASDGVPPSPVMAANGWTTALRMTVNKDFSFPSPAGVNLYPQGRTFTGNYALRFQMYLSLQANAINNSAPGSTPNEFAMFGLNHRGTNCNWKPTTPVTALTGGSGTTNIDGAWSVVNAGAGSITPADYDGFTGQTLPNGGSVEPVSNTALSQAGVFKHPPFVSQDTAASRIGGSPVNQWVDVSLEQTRQTNISLFIDRSQVLATYANTTIFTNGTIMLGYLDPVKDLGDPTSQFVYYSNVRVVELSPFITNQPISLIVTQGANVSFTSSATLGTAPITNVWYKGTGTAAVVPLQTNSVNATSFTDTLLLNNATAAIATNYYAVFSDSAGSVTSLVATLEVVPPPPNVVTNPGANARFIVTAVGPAAPTSFQWQTNGVSLTNSAHYSGVTANTLVITNAQAADAALTYSVIVGNASGSVTVSATLSFADLPSGAVVSPASQTNLWGSTATFTVSAPAGTPPFTYRWKTNGVNVSNGTHYSGATNTTLSISNITLADAVNYTVGVTNVVGSTTSTTGTLFVFIPSPTFSPPTVTIVGTNVMMSFVSTNIFDTTNAFKLLSSTVVTGPYTTNTAASFITAGAGTFQVTAPLGGSNMFYRLQHNN